MELDKIYENCVPNELRVKRLGDTFEVTFSFESGGEQHEVILIGVRETDNLCEILWAERMWIKRDESKQLEFGSYALGLSQDAYTEIVFDELGEKGEATS